MKVACGQFTVSSSIKHNFKIIKKLIDKSIKSQIQILFLPEASDYLSRNADHSFKLSQFTKDELIKPIQQELINYSNKGHDLFISIGVHEPEINKGTEETSGKTINKLLWINNKGEIKYQYEKLHLFDVDIKDGPILKESNSVKSGKKIIKPFEIDIDNNREFKIGLQICYDIRFPELSTLLFKNGANILTYPSAFTVKTGESHWKNLGRTRAIDNQSYVIMAAQCGKHDLNKDLEQNPIDQEGDGKKKVERISFGNSLIIDPWGDIINEGKKWDEELIEDEDGDYYELIIGELDYNKIQQIRQNMPLLNHRRNDIYELIDCSN